MTNEATLNKNYYVHNEAVQETEPNLKILFQWQPFQLQKLYAQMYR